MMLQERKLTLPEQLGCPQRVLGTMPFIGVPSLGINLLIYLA
jgi:hypothetical protein